jgi:hypothetical protein
MRRVAALAVAAVTAIVVAGCGGPSAAPAPAPDAPVAAAPTTGPGGLLPPGTPIGPDEVVAPDAPNPDSGAAQDNAALAPTAAVAVLPPSSDVTGTYPHACPRPAGASPQLPAPQCTPGAVRADVVEGNIGKNICVRGWTATIRPPQAETDPVKTASMAAYGVPQTSRRVTELDHLVPLELGGSNDVSNLWAQVGPGPSFGNPKDLVENDLRAAVCAHKVQLVDAQRAIAANWQTAKQVLHVP